MPQNARHTRQHYGQSRHLRLYRHAVHWSKHQRHGVAPLRPLGLRGADHPRGVLQGWLHGQPQQCARGLRLVAGAESDGCTRQEPHRLHHHL